MNDNANALASFITFVEGRRSALKREYGRSMNRDLAKQNSHGLMKRNFCAVLTQLYADAIKHLQQLEHAIDRNVKPETFAEVLMRPFNGLVDELLQHVLQHHRSSCALSNFSDEHNPSVPYIAEVLHMAEQDYAAFKQELNQLLLAESG